LVGLQLTWKRLCREWRPVQARGKLAQRRTGATIFGLRRWDRHSIA
jgi:hypothetical protein